jgi:RhtB (resistance to homoserine/threonine) family protein
MTPYLLEFAGLMAVFAVVIVAPGADFALVVRQSIVHGRRAAIASSVGIGCSLLFHIGYTIIGLSLIISQSLLLFGALKWIGAAYLIYIGVKSFSAPALSVDLTADGDAGSRGSLTGPFLTGFVTNALNPKALLFFLSIFSALVSHETPALVQATYGLGMAVALISWFVVVSYVFTLRSVRERFTAWGRWFNRVTGLIFIGLGLKLAAAQTR